MPQSLMAGHFFSKRYRMPPQGLKGDQNYAYRLSQKLTGSCVYVLVLSLILNPYRLHDYKKYIINNVDDYNVICNEIP